jgi:hypothetical protein
MVQHLRWYPNVVLLPGCQKYVCKLGTSQAYWSTRDDELQCKLTSANKWLGLENLHLFVYADWHLHKLSPDYPTFGYPTLFFPTCHVGPEKADRMSSSKALNCIETSLANVGQQRRVTTTHVLGFRLWRDLAAKERKQARNQYVLLISPKNKLNYIINLYYDNIYLCLWGFIIWFRGYFLRNLIIS